MLTVSEVKNLFNCWKIITKKHLKLKISLDLIEGVKYF